ncbi:trifunctional serine/threonine-protein kinase/ATP-binding protein/sensor histidine kinase [Aetokthonos hydrillicola Thurmond2011]|jgi:predicted ATPase/signal transduction histidine kinase|uniref:histidine kinase n=1 Tax=Aetokthonos hydrillicola Thurmond2011 TaxID=2712845 RepID=A0AAP5MB91_9CYAN|nr:ATP-binding sensor histidine kinase [Aetokthonos hydrillicola]MBO3463159.1 AAA family ATPase [Aetokthonos hydrillicola CCALA 1050]MBW4588847.1 AAA family ATPase [Aetokthonos hydrillicola CCALA 1050]MDR9897677.1 trifunctional serine/threonine-protein kinase/ATP-binding protein/sensor histidine kinase [Aetokthonos hydrillicola Thurmond2011]
MDSVSIAGYQLTENLYSGSRTLVYRGVRQTDSLPVVIKLLKNPYPSFSELVKFRNQYTIAKNLNSPLIVQIYSLEPYQNGYALVMEDFGGIALKDYFIYEGTLQRNSLKEFLQIAVVLCNALEILYRNRIIHKDIKPTNILINSETKQVKLIDFSIASFLPRETQTLISPNILEGTLAYISPEQTGRMNRGIDYRTDLYALGVTFYELLTGKLPFELSDPMELVHCHIAKQAPLVHEINPQIPSVLSQIVSTLMAKNAEDRYQSVLGVKFDLENCLRELTQTDKIESFEIRRRDVCDRFLIPEKLYGRETEVETLLQAFERVSSGVTEMMLVTGFSGIGKTAVVNEVHKPILKQRGYFIKGKFDQFQRNIPLSGFVQAFRDLMGQMLTENDAHRQQWKSKILEALGDNGQIIIEVIPELVGIIGEQPPAPELSGTAAQNRFNLLFQKFTQVFTSAKHPLVMFLDDLQWADSASLKLMQLLMTNTQHLLLIGAYRDNEVSPAHPLMLTLSEITKKQAKINTITLEPLNEDQVNELIADTLKSTKKFALPLSQLVYRKTQGNPFFTTQFLKALHQEELIQFDWNSGCWECDIAEVNQITVTDDVVEFMGFQLRRLPQSTQNILQLAACIGNQFDLGTLAIVAQKKEVETSADLWKALQEGLILPISDVYKFYQEDDNDKVLLENRNISQEFAKYKFLHDRIQQAAYSLIPDHQKQTTHYQIGQLLLQQISPQAREDRIFEIVNQLNYGTSLITQQKEKNQLAQLNLTACRKAQATTAYQAASEYARVGLSLLGEQAWLSQYDITLALHELTAEVAFLCGDFELMEQFINIVIQQAHSLLEKVNVYRIKIQSYISQNDFPSAIALGQQILLSLGVTFPETPTPNDIQQEIQEITALIGDRQIDDLAYLNVMTDSEKIAIFQIAKSFFAAAYLSGSPLFPLLICLSVKLSVQYGNISTSAFSYANYGMLFCNFLQDVERGTQFASLALQLVSKSDAKATKPDVLLLLAGYILHRKTHAKEMLPLLQEGYATALEVGKPEFAGHNAQCFCLNSFWCGQPLATLEQEVRAYSDGLVQLHQLADANYCRIHWQSILNLLGFAEYPVILSGEVLQETESLSMLLSTNDGYGLYIFYMYKLMLCFLFGEIEQAKNYAAQVRRYFMAGTGLVSEPAFYFYDSLITLAQLNQRLVEESEALEQVAQNQTQLQQYWARYAPMNHQHKVDLVEAEKYRVLGQKTEAIELYDEAIALANANQYIQEEALANELAANFYLDWGKQKIAADYMQQAYYCYARWGALAKIKDLEKRYPQLLQPILQQQQINLKPLETISSSSSSSTHTSSSGTTNICDLLDLTSVLKAAQAISSSLELDQLIANLSRIILENSGAKKSVLILPYEDTWQVKAITLINQQSNWQTRIETILKSQLIDNCQDIPKKIINYVKNTQETVIIDNCQTDIPGVIGEYMLQHQPQSVLCTPIINQGNLVGVLYLENQLTRGVFTSQRLQVINLLSSQAAISLLNARLYQQAKQALHDLQQAQLQIVQSEKMSALGNLVAGVAHEMNNPLGFIAASIRQAKPIITDIFEHLELYQNFLPSPNDEILDHAKEIDLDYTLEDLPKMIDSMKMACDRLIQISHSLRVFSRQDKDYKVRFNIHSGIDSTILILKHRLKANEQHPEIEVNTNYGDLPEIECFPGQLNQVFMNIIANAIDALEESNTGCSFEEIKANPNRITITTLVMNNQVQVKIADNGIGMDEQVKQKIFDYLFTTKAVGKGTGLGLAIGASPQRFAIARQIITEKHDGTLSVSSIPGKGTEFLITLPCAVE